MDCNHCTRITACASATIWITSLVMLSDPNAYDVNPIIGWSFFAVGLIIDIGIVLAIYCVPSTQLIPPTPPVPAGPQITSQQITPFNFLDIIDPKSDSVQIIDQSLPSNDVCCFSIIDKDTFNVIVSFLRPRELIKSISTSKQFLKTIQANQLWNKYLAHPELQLSSVQNESSIESCALKQLLAFNEFRTNQRKEGPYSPFLVHLARLMPGGPVAFNSIPKPKVSNIETFTCEMMTDSIIRGIDENGTSFFALRVIDQAKKSRDPIILKFIYSSTCVWEQKHNAYWKENTLIVSNKKTLNYILAIISKTFLDSEEFDSPIYIKTIKLV